MWKKGTIGSDKQTLHYRRDRRGTLHVHKSRVKAGQWRWDAAQASENFIVPETHYKSGLSSTLKEAKEAASHALAHMIQTNQ